MVRGKVSRNLLRNADAIAHLLDDNGKTVRDPSEGVIRAIDELTTLYALRKLDEGTRATLERLARDEAEGVDFVTHYLGHLRKQ